MYKMMANRLNDKMWPAEYSLHPPFGWKLDVSFKKSNSLHIYIIL